MDTCQCAPGYEFVGDYSRMHSRVMDNDIDVGNRLNELMQGHPLYRGRGQSALSTDAGVPQATISRILANKSVPEMATAIKLAKKFKVTCEWLLTGRGPKFIADIGAGELSANVLRHGLPANDGREDFPENVKNSLQSMLHALRTGDDLKGSDLRTIISYALMPFESGTIPTRIEPAPADTETALHDFVQASRQRAVEGAAGTRISHAEGNAGKKSRRHKP